MLPKFTKKKALVAKEGSKFGMILTGRDKRASKLVLVSPPNEVLVFKSRGFEGFETTDLGPTPRFWNPLREKGPPS